MIEFSGGVVIRTHRFVQHLSDPIHIAKTEDAIDAFFMEGDTTTLCGVSIRAHVMGRLAAEPTKICERCLRLFKEDGGS